MAESGHLEMLKNATFNPRMLFYLITPEETGRYTENPKFSDTAGMLFLVAIITEYLYLIIFLKRTPQFSDGLTSVTQGATMLTLRYLGVISLLSKPYQYVYTNYRLTTFEPEFWSTWTGWLYALLLVDCAYYWFHRINHEVNLFWSFHQVHHSSQHYNLTTALRQSCGNSLVSFQFYLPLALLGVTPLQMQLHMDLNLIYQFWIHTEAIGRLPWILELILNTPSHHRLHHGRNPRAIDTNYAGVLIIWDRMFGTFEPEWPEGTEPAKIDGVRHNTETVYGLVTNIQRFSTLYVQYHYFIQHYNRIKQGLTFPTWKYLSMGPGYSGKPGSPRLGDKSGVPQPEKPTKFLTSAVDSNWKALGYLIVHNFWHFQCIETAMKLSGSTSLFWKLIFVGSFWLQVESEGSFMERGKIDHWRQGSLTLGVAWLNYYLFSSSLVGLYIPGLLLIWMVLLT